MTELVRADEAHTLTQQMDYARAVSSANLLPQAYRGKPADIMIAVGLGEAMGLSPAESLYRIDVIQGKPTASAELIAANVRKAGHKLRLRVDERAVSATCTIIRADDPDYEHTVTRDRAWAQQMGLAGKDNYKKQPATMLGWRAVTACARMACPEALYGVAYTADEMWDAGTVEPRRSGLAAALADPSPAPDVPASEPVTDDAAADVRPPQDVEQRAGEDIVDAEPMFDYRSGWARAEFFPALRAAEEGGHFTDAKDFMSEVVGRRIESSKELTEAEAHQVLAHLPAIAAEQPAGGDQ